VLCGQSADSAKESCAERAFWVNHLVNSNRIDPKTIPNGTLVTGKPFGYEQRKDDRAEWDVPDYDAVGIGPVFEVKGALTGFPV
jgi:hypothetical protein